MPLTVHGGQNFHGEAPPIVPSVEIAHLSLAAILAKFPAELRKCVQTLPDASVMVTLPMPTILKQLPSCSVKMSLASLYRQAPAGVFKSGPPEDKRMVEVPLPEIFKRVRPELLKRRQDQRPSQYADEGFNLFGDKENPHAVALTLPAEREPAPAPAPPPVVDFGPGPSAEPTLKVAASEPEKAVERPPLAPPADLTAAAKPAPKPKKSQPAAAPAAPAPKAAKPAATTVKTDGPPLVLAIGDLAAGWPELIRAEVGAMNGSTVSLPSGEVTAGLAKGRVAFQWGQLREWITPVPPGASGADADTELSLPLRVVAPAFLKLTKGSSESRKRAAISEEIPSLFHGAESPGAAPTQPAAPAASAVMEPVEAPAKPAAKTVPAKPVSVPSAPAAAPLPQTINELFNQPDKASWSPSEIVENAVKLPGVIGAVVAMQEGLLVAHRLPEHLNGETFAAFLPQIFARLNKYAGEMKIGVVNSITVQAAGAPCQMYQHGEILFAAVGRTGEALPIHALDLCAGQFKK